MRREAMVDFMLGARSEWQSFLEAAAVGPSAHKGYEKYLCKFENWAAGRELQLGSDGEIDAALVEFMNTEFGLSS